jgi:hypothetical protein
MSHLVNEEIVHLNIDNYLPGVYYCRNHFKKGGTCIYIHNSLTFSTINLENDCYDKDIEVCAVCINSNSYSICILSVYRSPTSNYDLFLEKIERILHILCKRYVRVIICGDFNVNCMDDCPRKKQLADLLNTFNLGSIIMFPTRVGPSTSMIIDNVFIDDWHYNAY